MTTSLPHIEPTTLDGSSTHHMPASPDASDRSLGDLLGSLAQDAQDLVKAEMAMAKEEIATQAKSLARYIAMLVGASLLGAAGVILVGHFLAQAIDTVTPEWVAYLLVTLLYFGGAALLALKAKQGLEEEGAPVPSHTIDHIKEDSKWIRDTM